MAGVITAGAFRGNGGTIWIQMVSKYCEAQKLKDDGKNVRNKDRYDFDEVFW